MITRVIETIKKDYAGVVISSPPYLPLPRDIDIYVPLPKREGVVSYLQREGFVCRSTAAICQARKFSGGECFFIDLMFSPELLKNKISASSASPTLRGFILFIFRAVLSRLRRIGKGKIIAVIGADGSGKTTVCERLAVALFAKRMYMGDYDLALQKVYDRLYKLPVVFARFVHLPILIENYIRYAKAFFLARILGETVLVDRYAGFNRVLRRNNIWLKINDMIYRFFPNADFYLLLSAPPETIRSRRRELTAEEIAETQENSRLRLARKKHFKEIENVDLDACLNEALQFILG